METMHGNGRFDRYYRRIQLGLRLLSHGARAQTASEWSELTPDRLVTLRRRWLPDASEGLRGPAPTSFQIFFRSALRTSHATLFATIHQTLCQGSDASAKREAHPSLESGEFLCEAYEIFREWEEDADMGFDQAVLLAEGAAKGEVIKLAHCPRCRRAVLIDKLARRRETCPTCRRHSVNL